MNQTSRGAGRKTQRPPTEPPARERLRDERLTQNGWGGGAGTSFIGAAVAVGFKAQALKDVGMRLEPGDLPFPGGLAGLLPHGTRPPDRDAPPQKITSHRWGVKWLRNDHRLEPRAHPIPPGKATTQAGEGIRCVGKSSSSQSESRRSRKAKRNNKGGQGAYLFEGRPGESIQAPILRRDFICGNAGVSWSPDSGEVAWKTIPMRNGKFY